MDLWSSREIQKQTPVDKEQEQQRILLLENSPGNLDLRRARPESAELPSMEISNRRQALFSTVPDGPRFRDSSDPLVGRRLPLEPAPAEPGNAEQLIELIASQSFQNKDGSLTEAAAESIRAAIEYRDHFSTTLEQRAAEVQAYVNQRTHGAPLSLQVHSENVNSNSSPGSSHFVMATIGRRTARIPVTP